MKINVRSRSIISFGRSEIDLSCVEQLVDIAQTRAVADAIYRISRRCAAGPLPLKEVLRQLELDMDKDGLDILSPFRGQVFGWYALPRRFEVAAAVNRMRTLTVRQLGRSG